LFEMEDELSVKYSIGTETNQNQIVLRKKITTITINKKHSLIYQCSKDHISTGAGTTGVAYTLIITKSHVRIELVIVSSSKETTKCI
jgi:hypothetical protein